MTTKHTQGKWTDNKDNTIRTESRTILAQICNSWELEKEAEANAKLIASAPELLEVLNQAVLRLEEYPTFSRQYSEDEKTFLISAKKVIKKATL